MVVQNMQIDPSINCEPLSWIYAILHALNAKNFFNKLKKNIIQDYIYVRYKRINRFRSK